MSDGRLLPYSARWCGYGYGSCLLFAKDEREAMEAALGKSITFPDDRRLGSEGWIPRPIRREIEEWRAGQKVM